MGLPPPALLDLAAGRDVRDVSRDDAMGLVRSAVEHRMQGLLWRTVASGDIDLPGPAKEVLAEDALAVRVHHRRLWGVLTQVVDRLHATGIEVGTTKGVTAEARWYDGDGDRPCSDVDLFVPRHQLDRISDLFAVLQPDHPLAGCAQELVASGALQSVELYVSGVSVDVHFDVFKLGIPSRHNGSAWSRTSPFPLPGGGTVPVLDAETSLVNFLLHLNKDRFRRLLGFADVARVLGREDLDLGLVHDIAARDGLEVPVVCSLSVVLDTLELTGPRLGSGGWRAGLWGVLWRPSVRLRGEIARIQFRSRQAWIPVTARGRARDTARLWSRIALPPPALVAYRNPGVDGSYLVRLTRGRIVRVAARRRRLEELSR